MNPRWPIYVVSKGRWESRMTVKSFEAMRVPYKVIVERQELELYAAVVPRDKLIELDTEFQRTYDACCALQPGESKGSGPARNMAWHLAKQAGAEWHWVVDDNIDGFYVYNHNQKVLAGDGLMFRCMEDFAARWSNVAMAGPHYEMFVLRKAKRPPFILNSRVYSCNLIRTAAPFRWRCRWNEDTDLSLRMLKAGWCTVLFNAFLQHKRRTLFMKGGNMDELYKHGTEAKSAMLSALHPDVARVTRKFNRVHHHVDYSGFTQRLIPDPRAVPVDHRMELREVGNVPWNKDWRTKA